MQKRALIRKFRLYKSLSSRNKLKLHRKRVVFKLLFNDYYPTLYVKFSMVTIISEEVLTYKKKKFIIIKNVLLMRYIKIQVAQSMKFQKY